MKAGGRGLEWLKNLGCIVWILSAFVVPGLIGWALSTTSTALGAIVGFVLCIAILWKSIDILDKAGMFDFPEEVDYEE